MAIVDGATLLVRALQRQGISHLFSVSAGARTFDMLQLNTAVLPSWFTVAGLTLTDTELCLA